MFKILLLFYLLTTQNVQTQLVQNGCSGKKISNLDLSQLLGINLINPRSAYNVDLPSNYGIPPQNGHIMINGLNSNNIAISSDFLTSNLVPNKGTNSVNNVLRTNNNSPSQLTNNPLVNELIVRAIAASTSNVPNIKSTINNKLLNNGIQYNIGIQIDKKDLLNKIINNNGANKGIIEALKIVKEDARPVNSNIYYNENEYQQRLMSDMPYHLNNPVSKNENFMQFDSFASPWGRLPDHNGINHMGNTALRTDVPFTNHVVNSIEEMNGVMPHKTNNVPFSKQLYLQNDVGPQSNSIVFEQAIPITPGIHVAHDQLSIQFPNSKPMMFEIPENVIKDSLINNIVPNSDPMLNTLFITNIMPEPTQFDNIADTGNLYNPHLNIPANNNLLNANELINYSQIPLNHINTEVQLPNLELNMPSSSLQFVESITDSNGLSSNNFVNANSVDINTQTPMNIMPQSNQINDMQITGSQYGEHLFNLPVTLTQLEESLGNIHLSMPTKLPDWNTLNLGQYGCLPIINGLPVAGITETVTVMNPNI